MFRDERGKRDAGHEGFVYGLPVGMSTNVAGARHDAYVVRLTGGMSRP